MSQQQFVPTPRFEEYSERFRDFYRMTRREDGVLLVEAHTNGRSHHDPAGEGHIRSTADYVREGRKNNFD
jgi:hypothetical protein